MKKITIYDLAELSGVSASAVSAILNGNWKKRRISAKLAEKVTRIAEEQGYAINRQASMLRSKKSHVIGMIIPKYDNRYFGSIAERFEEMARACTRRRPELEIEAVKAMLSWQVDWVVATGATNPDKISALCQQAGVPTVNLDLPGSLSPSVISDNYGGAKALTHKILANSARR
ncbi:LacI family DNA-binding transcriptional regulator, partial [Klebsiella pneumoniae]|uniref:LacI family DNA-binding transcriptional regulator n=1 Tax=Klebsiella pneumoniae TaxID=573 RepID=UPI000D969126